MLEISEIFDKMIKKIDETRHFCGSDENPHDFNATTILAKTCDNYKDDVEEEINWENEVTCYNCRYRRWTKYGFSCIKNFPVEKFVGRKTD